MISVLFVTFTRTSDLREYLFYLLRWWLCECWWWVWRCQNAFTTRTRQKLTQIRFRWSCWHCRWRCENSFSLKYRFHIVSSFRFSNLWHETAFTVHLSHFQQNKKFIFHSDFYQINTSSQRSSNEVHKVRKNPRMIHSHKLYCSFIEESEKYFIHEWNVRKINIVEKE